MLNREFTNRIELLSYTERRVFIDVDAYARMLLRMGDIFQPDPCGVYHAVTGECLVDFGKGSYYLRKKGSRVEQVDIRDFHDFENAQGAIYDLNGNVVISPINIRRVQVSDHRSPIAKAYEAAGVLYGRELFDALPHARVSRGLPEIEECLYMREIEETPHLFKELAAIEDVINRDIQNNFSNDHFKEILLSKRSGAFIVDVSLDYRIKEYYLRKFEEQELERNQQNGELY